MKKSLLALAVLGSFAGVASAQTSNVTLFGVIDLSADYVKNGSTKLKSMESNELSSNRIGFRGVEDLGNGLSAGFWLEAGMSNDTGNGAATGGGLNFNRRSTVSLMGNFGEVRLGHDYTPIFWNYATFDVFGANGIASSDNLAAYSQGSVGLGSSLVRTNNGIAYFLPSNLGGLYGWFQVAAGEATAGRSEAARIGFATGPFDAAVSYGVVKSDAVGTPPGTPDFKNLSAGGDWDFGVIKIYGLYNQAKQDPRKLSTYELSAGVPIGLGAFNVAFTHAKFAGAAPGATVDVGSANLLGAQYIYNLSKRTSLYVTAAYLKNKDGAVFTVNGAAPAYSATDLSGGNVKSTGANVGIRHAF